MSFTFEETNINNLMLITPHVFHDERGEYKKTYEKNIFFENGICDVFNESSDLTSKKGSLRGLHYQTKESQAKLLHVVKGKLFDVALDLRSESSTFGKYYYDTLEANDNKVLYIPEGFAHGFIALEDDTIFSYRCSGTYLPEYCGGIRWDDKELSIPWPLKEYGIEKVIATDKDLSWPTFSEYKEMMELF